MSAWWNEPLLGREFAAYLLLCVLTVWWLAKIVSKREPISDPVEGQFQADPKPQVGRGDRG